MKIKFKNMFAGIKELIREKIIELRLREKGYLE